MNSQLIQRTNAVKHKDYFLCDDMYNYFYVFYYSLPCILISLYRFEILFIISTTSCQKCSNQLLYTNP